MARTRHPAADLLADSSEASLLDIIDNVLAKGVVLSGDVTLALADVDLVYLRLSVLLCAADRVLPDAGARRTVKARGRARTPAARTPRT